MIKFLFKYATVIFVFNTVLLAIESTKFFAYQIFLGDEALQHFFEVYRY